MFYPRNLMLFFSCAQVEKDRQPVRPPCCNTPKNLTSAHVRVVVRALFDFMGGLQLLLRQPHCVWLCSVFIFHMDLRKISELCVQLLHTILLLSGKQFLGLQIPACNIIPGKLPIGTWMVFKVVVKIAEKSGDITAHFYCSGNSATMQLSLTMWHKQFTSRW